MKATLKHGNTYNIGGKKFVNGKPREITADERRVLESAVVVIGGEEVPRFEFEKAKREAAKGTLAERDEKTNGAKAETE